MSARKAGRPDEDLTSLKWCRDRDACFLILGNLQMLPTRKCSSKSVEEPYSFSSRILLESAFHFLALTLLAVLHLGFLVTSPMTSTPPVARSVDLRALGPRVRTEPLQDMQLRLRVLFVNGLRDRLPVLILQVGVRAFKTEPHEILVDLVHHTASMGQNFFVPVECPLDPLVLEFLMGLVDR